jgi:ketosteroid isomerase-like protein
VIQSDFVIAFTVRDGRITRYRLFEDSDAVHAAAWPD